MLLTVNFILVLCIAGFTATLGRRKAVRLVGGDVKQLRSLPGHYGWYGAAWALIPALLVMALWAGFAGVVLDNVMLAEIAAQNPGFSEQARLYALVDLQHYLYGGGFGGDADGVYRGYLDQYALMARVGNWVTFFVSVTLSLLGGYWGVHAAQPAFRARDRLERLIKAFMIICSTAAVLVTVGIILSLVFETIRFFALVPVTEFFIWTGMEPANCSSR